jgi:hypothetical protein
MTEKKSSQFKKKQKELILKALTDPAFRKSLTMEPERALNKKLSPEKITEIKMILAVVKGIEDQISHLADELLCANGGPCGIGKPTGGTSIPV